MDSLHKFKAGFLLLLTVFLLAGCCVSKQPMIPPDYSEPIGPYNIGLE